VGAGRVSFCDDSEGRAIVQRPTVPLFDRLMYHGVPTAPGR
jgi:hypothetical protein